MAAGRQARHLVHINTLKTNLIKWQRLYTVDIVELILDKDSNAVVSDCDQCDNDVSDYAWRKQTLIISLVINLAKEKI
jgi:hypothetical protein